MSSAHLPPIAVCEQARLARDARFDGIFFTAVRTTRIYCRPVCPAPAPHPENVEYHPSAASAEAAGYRPCLRCRPELSPGHGAWRRADTVIGRALRLLETGHAPVADIARQLHLSERHLRRLFQDELGTSPQQVQITHRLLFAKQLLTDTRLPLIQVAEAAGFGSLRRFNDAFMRAYGMPPSRLRKAARADITSPTPAPSTAPGDGPRGQPHQALTLRLGYRPPFDFGASLAFLQRRAMPGIEDVSDRHYARTLNADGAWLALRAWGDGQPALRLTLHGVSPAALPDIVRRTRQMFDLDADPQAITARLAGSPGLAALAERWPGLRLPGGWDGTEVAIRAILGQQVSVAAATTLACRLVQHYGQPLVTPPTPTLHSLFPSVSALAGLDGDTLASTLGLPRRRAATLVSVARALHEQQIGFQPAQPLSDFVAAWTALPGIGDWTAHYIAMRALGHPDAFPAADLILRRQAARVLSPRPAADMHDDSDDILSERELLALSAEWQPWRAYTVILLWHAAGNPESSTATLSSPRGQP